VSVNDDLLRKHDQPRYFGSREHEAVYSQRTYVEGAFRSLKNRDTENVSRGFTKYVGLPRIALGITLAAVVVNVRHQRKFYTGRDTAPDHPILDPGAPYLGHRPLSPEDLAHLDALHRPAV
jgi:hypothetical protein